MQSVSCDDFLPRTHAHLHTRFSAACTSHARVPFAKNLIAHRTHVCVLRVSFAQIRTRTRTFAQTGRNFVFLLNRIC